MPHSENAHVVYIVSDATGETAYRVTRAALAQFKDTLIELEWRQGTRTVERICEIGREAAETGGLIVHSFAIPEFRETLLAESRAHGVPCVDVIGPVLMHFSEWLGVDPANQPGITRSIGQEYFRRITALEFAVQHDDGRAAHELDRADLVLVGVSRTSKTPLSIYFAHRGWLVGNVPIVPGVPLPPILYELPRGCVVALSIRPERLLALRGARQSALRMTGSYDDPTSVYEELRYARQIIAQAGWPVVDMSVKSIEEAASEILQLIDCKKDPEGRTNRA